MFEFDIGRKHADDATSVGRPSAERGPATGARRGSPAAVLDLDTAVVQAKLTVGPAGDRFEREADAVADRVVRSLHSVPTPAETDAEHDAEHRAEHGVGAGGATPTVARRVQRAAKVGLAGGELDDDTAQHLQSARSGGSPMSPVMRSTMETAMGADFSQVRIHTGARAAELNDRIQAKAFTVGNDIFFRDGVPDVSRSTGQHLVAHELTHTIQQGASSQEHGARRVMRRKAVDSPIGGQIVPPEVRERRTGGAVQAKFSLKKAATGLKQKAKQLFGRGDRDDVKPTEVESPVLKDASPAAVDEYARTTKGSGPGENPDYSNTKLWGARPDGFRITLAVAQERADWMADVKALKRAALANPSILIKALQGAQVQVPDPNGTGTLSKDPKDVVMAIAHESREAERQREGQAVRTLKEFSNGIHDVGHTWVRLDTLVGGEVKERYSYGMWPQKVYDPADNDDAGGYAGFIDAGPGEVRHPDTAHEGDALTAYQDYKVGRTQFDKALATAVKRYYSPPPYVLTGYNCTAFAREIVQSGGGSYPGSGLLPGFAYTPGDLYAAILKRSSLNGSGARQGSDEGDKAITARIDARHKAWKRAGKDAADKRHEELSGRQAPRARRKKPVATALAPDRTITIWNGTIEAPTEATAPFDVRGFTGPNQFRPTGNEGNGFIEVTDQRSDFFWIRKDEYLAGGTPSEDESDTTVTDEGVTRVEFDTILELIRKAGFDGLGSDMLAQVIDDGRYGFTGDDISAALQVDTENRARRLADLVDGSDDASIVMAWWGRS